MKKILVGVGLVVLFTGNAFGIGGLGGYIVYNQFVGSGLTQVVRVSRFEVDGSFTGVAGSTESIDNLHVYNTYTYGTKHYWKGNVEVYDPRDKGGTGKYLVTAMEDNAIPAFGGSAYLIPWDVYMVDPSSPGTHTMISNGSDSAAHYRTEWAEVALRTSENWDGVSNGLGIVTKSQYRNYVCTMYDADDNGMIDDTSTEGRRIASTGNTMKGDIEFGDDDALYRSWASTDAGARKINRTWIDGGGGVHDEVYLDTTASRTFGTGYYGYSGFGLAVGPVASNPIVYLFCRDNVDSAANRWAIFGMRESDTDADNVITFGGGSTDVVELVWRSGELGIDIHTDLNEKNIHSAMDLELYVNPDNGDQILLANIYYNNKLFALRLADNGLRAIEGSYVSGGGAPAIMATSFQFFEIDMNPGAEIPEPGTLLLLGTGVLGALGYIRRRRMR